MVIAEKQLGIKLLLHAVGADRSPNLGERQLRFLVSESQNLCLPGRTSVRSAYPSQWLAEGPDDLEITSHRPARFCENKTVPEGVAEAAACSGQRDEPSGAAAAKSLEETALSNIMS